MWIDSYYGGIPIPSKMSGKKLAKYETDMEFLNTFNNLFNSALNVFKWDGLPETCNERFLERSLLLRGSALIVKKDDAFINLACVPGNGYNIYGDFTKAWGYGLNGYNEEFKLYVPGAELSDAVVKTAGGYTEKGAFDAVMCRDNKLMYPYIQYLYLTAKRLTDTMRSLDVLVQNLKSPVIITCEDQSVKSVQELLRARADNEYAVVGHGSLPVDSFKVWDTKANPQSLQVMWEHYERLVNNWQELFGINSQPQIDKKERLLVDEVNANNQITDMNVEKRLATRQEFCDQLNKAFGLNVSVSLRVQRDEEMLEEDDTMEEEDDDNVDTE